MKKPPIAVTVIAWLSIAAGVLGFTVHLRGLVSRKSFHLEDLIHLDQAVLGTTAVALGRDVRRRRARTLPGEPARRSGHDRQPARADCEYLVLGGPEAHRQRRLRGLESRDRQDDCGYSC